MNKTISLILLLLIGFGVNAAAADNTVKTSFASVTVPNGWEIWQPEKPEYRLEATYKDVTIKQKLFSFHLHKDTHITISRYDTGKTANIDGTKAYIERMQRGNPERLSNLKWEFDKTRNMWIGTDEKIAASYNNPNTKIARKYVIYLHLNGKYIDVFEVDLTNSAVKDPEIAKQIDAIFKSWTPNPVKK